MKELIKDLNGTWAKAQERFDWAELKTINQIGIFQEFPIFGST